MLNKYQKILILAVSSFVLLFAFADSVPSHHISPEISIYDLSARCKTGFLSTFVSFKWSAANTSPPDYSGRYKFYEDSEGLKDDRIVFGPGEVKDWPVNGSSGPGCPRGWVEIKTFDEHYNFLETKRLDFDYCETSPCGGDGNGGNGPVCGDGICDVGENCNNCSVDCGACPPPCECTPFTDQGCGADACDSDRMYKTRTCNPPGCALESLCAFSRSCSGNGNGNGGALTCSPPSQIVGINRPASFTASGGRNNLYIWVAPGGNPSYGRGSSFYTRYRVRGTYRVTVSSLSHPYRDTCSVTVVSNLPPVADATVSDSSTGPYQTAIAVQPGETLYFFSSQDGNGDGQGSYDEDGTITLYEWDWEGDGIYDWRSDSSGDTTHIYSTAGSYSATLRVTDDKGAQDTDTVIVSVLLPPIDINCSADPSQANIGQEVTWTAEASGGKLPYSFSWSGSAFDEAQDCDFDPPSQNPNKVKNCTYDKEGIYEAKVVVTDDNGNSAGCESQVEVSTCLPIWREIPPVSWLRYILACILNF